jgi:hypothetical protein
MRRRQSVLALITILALLIPATVSAQGGVPSATRFSLWAQLRGDTEIPPADPDGFGFARVTIDLSDGSLCYRLSVARIDPATASHIHEAAAGATGPVVVPFEAPSEGLVNGCTLVDAALGARIVGNPSGYYVNVHNAEFPAGAIRGQLMPLGYSPDAVEQPAWAIDPAPVAEGLDNPRGIDMGGDGALYVAEAGTGGDMCFEIDAGPDGPSTLCLGATGAVTRIADGAAEQVGGGLASLADETGTFSTGPHDVALGADGSVYTVVGLGANPADRDAIAAEVPIAGELGWLYGLGADNTWTAMADVAGYEGTANPDGSEAPDSNPYGIAMDGDTLLVADAGGNDLLTVAPDGTIATYAVFEQELVEAPPELGLPPGEMIPMDAVPTAVAVGPDGAYYVGLLTGFPFPVGGAKIWRLEDLNGDGDALDDGEKTVYASGLTALVDIEFGPDGTLYAVSIAKNGLLAAETAPPDDVGAVTGALLRVSPDGAHEEIVSVGLILPGGVAVAADGTFYVTNFSTFPEMGAVVHVVPNE